MHGNFIFGIIALVLGIGLVATRMQHKDYDKSTNVIGTVFIVAAAFLIIFSFIRIVPAGTVGIVDLFGKVSETERKPGLNLVNPFAKLVIFNTKTEEVKEVMVVPSKEGLTIKLDVSLLYRVEADQAADIYKTVGEHYRNIVLLPQFRSVSRGVTVNYEAKALYTSGRDEMASRIFQDLKGLLEARGIVLENVLLREIQLPPTVAHAIEMKLKAEQEAEQMKFVLEKERKEAERRVIEAEGIAKAQEIINKTLTQAYLQHEAIQAQMIMATNPNHTTVYIPSGDNGIPLVRVMEP
jgi:regulator of protease activity HflC (stomatin/prohibitin superfamily)